MYLIFIFHCYCSDTHIQQELETSWLYLIGEKQYTCLEQKPVLRWIKVLHIEFHHIAPSTPEPQESPYN